MGVNGFIGILDKRKRKFGTGRSLQRLVDAVQRGKAATDQGSLAVAASPGGPGTGRRAAGTLHGRKPQRGTLEATAVRQCATKLWMAVGLLADYEDLARKLILAHHTASRYA
jgi:hypothetical protein